MDEHPTHINHLNSSQVYSGDTDGQVTAQLHHKKQTFIDIPHNFYGPCKVCAADATGLHYGVASCEGCKGFFKRSLEVLTGSQQYSCVTGLNTCTVKTLTRNACRACRLRKCKEVGMEWKAHRKRIRMKNLISGVVKLSDIPRTSTTLNNGVETDVKPNKSALNACGSSSVMCESKHEQFRDYAVHAAACSRNSIIIAPPGEHATITTGGSVRNNFTQLFLTVDELLREHAEETATSSANNNYGQNDLPIFDDAVLTASSRKSISPRKFHPVESDMAASQSLSYESELISESLPLHLPPKKAYTWRAARGLAPHVANEAAQHISLQLQQSESDNLIGINSDRLLLPEATMKPRESTSSPSSYASAGSAYGGSMHSGVRKNEYLVNYLSHLLSDLTCSRASSTSAATSATCSNTSAALNTACKKPSDFLGGFGKIGLLQDSLTSEVLKRAAENSRTENIHITPRKRGADADDDDDNSNEMAENSFSEGRIKNNGDDDVPFCSRDAEKEGDCMPIIDGEIVSDRQDNKTDDGIVAVREEIRSCVLNILANKCGQNNRDYGRDDGYTETIRQLLADPANRRQHRFASSTMPQHFHDIWRPNTTITSASAQQLHKGFVDCWLEELACGRSLQLLLHNQPRYEPQTSIDRFMAALNVHMAQIAVRGMRFGDNFVPSFWRLEPHTKMFCLAKNLTLTFYAIFSDLIERDNSFVILLQQQQSTCNEPVSAEWAIHCSDYWLRYSFPEPLIKFNKNLAAFIVSMHLPDSVRIILAAAAWCYPPVLKNMPEQFRPLVYAGLRLDNKAMHTYERTLRPIHEYLLRLVMSAVERHFNADAEQAKILRNKILFLFRMITSRITLYSCHFVRNIPLNFYDDGTYDWERLHHYVTTACSPEVAHWMNAIWPLTLQVVDFSDTLFDVERVARQIENVIADTGGGSTASWAV